MADKIRVVRLIEYTYDNPERMASDMLHWTHTHKDGSMEMRSAVLQPEYLKDGE